MVGSVFEVDPVGLPLAPADKAVSISVLVVGTSAVAGGTVQGGLHLGQAVPMVGNCHSWRSNSHGWGGNCDSGGTSLHNNWGNVVLNGNRCNGDGDLLANLTSHLLCHGGADLASHLVALLHRGHHSGLHGH